MSDRVELPVFHTCFLRSRYDENIHMMGLSRLVLSCLPQLFVLGSTSGGVHEQSRDGQQLPRTRNHWVSGVSGTYGYLADRRQCHPPAPRTVTLNAGDTLGSFPGC